MKITTLYLCVLIFLHLLTPIKMVGQLNKFAAVISRDGRAHFEGIFPNFKIQLTDSGKIISLISQKNIKNLNSLKEQYDYVGNIKIRRDHLNRIKSIGGINFKYDIQNHLLSVGNMFINYNFLFGKIESINYKSVKYDFVTGKVLIIGRCRVQYDLYGNIATINNKDSDVTVKLF